MIYIETKKKENSFVDSHKPNLI